MQPKLTLERPILTEPHADRWVDGDLAVARLVRNMLYGGSC